MTRKTALVNSCCLVAAALFSWAWMVQHAPVPVEVEMPAPDLRGEQSAEPLISLPLPRPPPLPQPRPTASKDKHGHAAPSPIPCSIVQEALQRYDRSTIESEARNRGFSSEQIKQALGACQKGSHS